MTIFSRIIVWSFVVFAFSEKWNAYPDDSTKEETIIMILLSYCFENQGKEIVSDQELMQVLQSE